MALIATLLVARQSGPDRAPYPFSCEKPLRLGFLLVAPAGVRTLLGTGPFFFRRQRCPVFSGDLTHRLPERFHLNPGFDRLIERRRLLSGFAQQRIHASSEYLIPRKSALASDAIQLFVKRPCCLQPDRHRKIFGWSLLWLRFFSVLGGQISVLSRELESDDSKNS